MKIASLFLRSVIQFFPRKSWYYFFHSSRDTEIAIFNEVLAIRDTINPMEPALEPLVPFLSPAVISSIIQERGDLLLDFRFFIWASRRKRFRSWASHDLIIDMLSKEKGFDLFWLTLEELRKGRFLIASDAFLVLISGYAKMGLAEKAVESFGKMKEFDCKPDVFTYNAILHVTIRKEVLLLALAIYNQMLKGNCAPNKVTFSILIDGLCKSGKTQDALKMLDEMTNREISPDRITYTIVISGLCQAKREDDALRLFSTMKDRGLSPDSVCYNALLNGFCKSGRLDETFALLRSFEKDGFVLGVPGYTSLIDGLFRARRYDEAYAWYRTMFDKDVKPDVVLYSVVIRCLSEAGRVKEALLLLIMKNGFIPSPAVYRTLMTWSCRRRKVSMAFSFWFKYMKDVCGRDDKALKGIMEDFDKGKVEEAVRGLLKMDFESNEFGLAFYTICLIGFCQTGKVEEAMKIFYMLEEYKAIVTPPSCVKLIHGLCKKGNLDQAVDIFLYTLENGFKLMPRVCNYLLKSLIYSNDKREHAYNILRRMKSQGYELDSCLYKTTKSLLHGHLDTLEMESISPG
ncbi:pentatricopeptide repeat-containing protein At1g79540 [Carica papaya]|uniref:pentatricopeptide repeat-containing protein At1g79540 n=1 Tax=Carica papaya TaxID=3649 RepID=UPI000B8CA3E9|nr:pentatricopeptide repeat-containing protein At1g79540 [Carica papaya]